MSGLAVVPATLKIVDASPAEIVVSSSLTVSEDVMNSSYRVSLTSEPSATVHVSVSIEGYDFENSQIHLADGGSVGTLTLEFDSGNWDSGEDVEFVLTGNDYSGENPEETIIHSALGGGYDGAQPKILRVVVTDNDLPPTILLSLNREKLSEGHKGQFVVTARLEGISRMHTDLTLVLPGEEFTVNGGFSDRTILAGATAVSWSIDADVGINTILGDTRTVTFTVTTASGLAVVPATLKIVDASLAEIVVSSSLTVSEEAGNSSYRVSLTSQPTDTVFVTVRINDFANSPIRLIGGGGADGTLMLEFHSGNWESGQDVEFAVTGNDYSGENREETIIHSAAGGTAYDGAGEKRLQVVVTDDEEAAVRVSMTMSVLSATEADVLVVELLVRLVDSNDEVVMLPEGGETPVTFEFSPGEAAEDYTVVFSGPTTVQIPSTGVRSVLYNLTLIRDFIDEGDETFTITAKVAGLSDGSATFTIIDHPEDVRGIEIGAIADLMEGRDGMYTVVLKSRPTEPVTVTFSTTSGEVTLSPSSLVFSTTNWGTPQDIDVSAMDNLISDGQRDVEITYVVSGGDYDAFPLTPTIVTILDDVAASTRVGLSLEPSSAREGGATSTPVTVTVTAELDASSRFPITTVRLSLLLNLDADADDVDLHFPNGDTIEILSGETTASIDVRLTLTDNDIFEEDETFSILGSVVDLVDGEAHFTIIDDEEAAVRVSMTMSVLSGTEADDFVVDLIVHLVDRNDEVVMLPEGGETPVTFEVSPGEVAEDYTVVFSGPGTVQIPSTGVTSVSYALALIRDFIDEEDETFTITAKVAGLSDGAATFTIIDHPEDVRGIEIGTIADLREGSDGVYTVVLKSRPTEPVTVAFSTTSDEVTLSSSLVFSTTNWESPQNIVVSAMENSISGGQRDVEITYVVSGGDYDAFPLVTSTVTILDNDAASTRVDLSLEPADAREGEAASTPVTVTAELDASPRSEVTTVQLSLLLDLAADAADVDLLFPNGSTIEILSGETTASIEVSLTLTDNEIFEEDESFSILGSVVDLVDGAAIFTIMDDDVRGISVSQTTIELTEGASAGYSVVLTSEPTADVTITLNVIELEGVSISLSSMQLTFTPADWNTEQRLTVTADDNGHLQQPTATVTIEHLASGGGYDGAMPKRLQVVVTDDEEAAVRVSMTMSVLSGTEAEDIVVDLIVRLVDRNDEVVMLPEGGETPVTFEFSPGEATEDYTVGFTGPTTVQIPSTGVTSVSYTLALIRDFIDEEDETFTITAKVAGLSDGSATFTIIDHPEDVRGIEIGTIADLREGSDGVYTVVLKSRPTAPVTVAFSTTSDEVTLSSSLVFSTTNWESPQNIVVSAMENSISGGQRDVEITYVVSGGDYDAFPLVTSTVTILDNDAASTRVDLSLEPADAREGDATSTPVTVTAELDASPRSEVTTVQLSLLLDLEADAADVALLFPNGSTIEILSGETTASIEVSLTLTDNEIFEEDESFSILGSVVDLVDGEAIFTIMDDDVRGISVSQTTIELTEGASAGYDLVLTSEPTAEVTIELSFIEAAGFSISLSARQLTFTPADWSTGQRLTVTVADNDHIQQRTTTVTIEHLASGGDYAGLQASVKVTVMDDEPESAMIILSLLDESSMNLENLAESGGSLTVYVEAAIDRRLYVDVPIALTYGGAAAVSDDYTLTPVDPVDGALLIPAGEQSGTAEFRLTLNDDRIDEEDETVEIVGTVSSGPAASFIASISGASFLINDNDTRAVLVTPEAVTVPEGESISYNVRLDSQPVGGDVVVKITGVTRAADVLQDGRTLSFSLQDPPGDTRTTSAYDRTSGAFVLAGDPIILTFNAMNWSTEQRVYVELSSNGVVQDDSEATIVHSVSGGDYSSETVPDVVLKLTEFGFFVTGPISADVPEGGSAEYSIRLASQPDDTVIVNLMLPPNPSIDLSLAPVEVLTFSTTDWDEAQSVIVAYGNDDLSTGNQTLEITHSAESSDANYDSGGVSVVAVRLNFLDDEDLPRLRLLLSPNSAVEGSGGTGGPAIQVMVTAEFDGPARSEETIISLTLARNNTADAEDYSTDLSPDAFLVIPQGERSGTVGALHSSFTLTLFQDDIDEGDAEGFTLIAADDAGILAAVSTAFTIVDDDRAGMEVTPVGPRRLRKGQDTEYSVVLTSEPTATVMVSVEALAAGTSEVDPAVDVGIAGAPISFDGSNWFVPQRVTVSALEPAGVAPRFGEVNIVFSVASDVASYDGTFGETRILEIIDVDATLRRLQLMVGGEEIVLTNLADGSTGFMSDDREYSATIPFDVNQVTITAAPTITETLMAGDQASGEVRIFGTNHPRDAGGEGASGAELIVTLDLSGEDDFTFFVEVFVPVAGDDPVIETYTLTLTRALSANAELLVFRADDEGRQNPLNDGGEDDTLIFGPEDEIMELVLVLTDGVDDYSISELLLSGFSNTDAPITIMSSEPGNASRQFRVEIDPEETRTLETKVTLSRVDPRGEDFEFSLTFEAEAARPVAADADAFTAEIDVFLEDNTPTNTQISVAYRGDSQGQAETLTPTQEIIRVSDNGTVTISLEVIYESGGMRSFEQGSFTFSVVSDPVADPRVTLEGGILKINPEGDGTMIQVTVSAVADPELVNRGFSPRAPDPLAPLGFTVKFEHPTANIQPVAELDPVREFTDPLFVFVGELKELPLEVVLAEDSTPLDGSGDILRDLALTSTTDIPEDFAAATVSIRVGDAEAGSPGRILSFEVAAVKNNVLVDVAVEVNDQDPRVTVVDVFSFNTHFLSLEHEDGIQFSEVGNRGGDFAPDFEVITVSLAGEDPAGESWTLSVANRDQLEVDGHYSVEEVILETRITQVNQIVKKTVVAGTATTYEIGTETLLDGEVSEPPVFVEVDTTTLSADVWAFLFESPASTETRTLLSEIARKDYRPLTAEEMEMDLATRFLRITRLLPGAEDSRVRLRFDYYLPGVAELEGFFHRTVAIDTGLVAELRMEVTPDPVVVPKGGTAEVTLVVSNLLLDEDPADFITFRTDADLSIAPLGNANLDPIGRRFEQTLEVTVDENAGEPSYKVVVEVRLRGKVFATEFTVDVNNPPQYEGPRRLTVYESDTGDEAEPRTMAFGLRIVDSDGGKNLLEPTGLTLDVVGFGISSFNLGTGQEYNNDYFDLITTAAIRDQGDEGESASGQFNSLAVTLTLVGKLAMPYGSVVELRLSGVDDGYGDGSGDGFGDIVGSLFVRVEDVAPVFKLATNTVAFLDEEARIPFLESFSDGSTEGSGVPTVLVVEAPDDLLVRYDADAQEVTLLRLNAEQEEPGEVKLVVLDSQGGRTEVTITVERPALLPEIVPPKPLLLSIGETRILQTRLAEDTDMDVIWSVDSSSVPGIDVVVNESLAGGHAELSLTALDTAEEAEYSLTLTAEDGVYTRTATLFVVVVAAEAKPRLKLRLLMLAPDGSGESATIATLTPTLTAVSLQADLEGTLPDLEMLKGSDGFVSFQITFERRRQGALFTTIPTTVATVEVEEGDSGLSIMEPIGEQLARLALAAGDEVSLSIEHWKDGAPTNNEFIVGDALVLPVLGRVIFDRDNDGLADSIEPDPDNPDPGVLGPVTAEFAGGGANKVSLSLGNLARSLVLAECGGVSLTLTVDEDGATETTGCGADLLSLDPTFVESVAAAFGPGTYQFFDLLATFDSGLADPDAFLLITMLLPPAEPQTAYRVYRFEGTTWVPVIDAGPSSGSGSGAIGPSVQGATGMNGEDSLSFYAFDFDRDGSVPLSLLVVPVPAEAPSVQVDSMYRDRTFNIDVGMPRIVRLGLAAGFTAVATGSGNVDAEVQTATIDGSVVPVVKLSGQKRTKNGAEAVVIVAFDEDGNAVATTTLYVAVANQAPAIKFFRALLNGERGEQITTTFELAPGSQTEVIVVLEDPDGDENFVLGLTGGGGGIAEFVPRLGLDDQGVAQVTNILILTAGDRPRSPFEVALTATDQSDLSEALGELEVCVLNESGLCPAASKGGDGSGGGSGLLWLFLAAPAVLARLRRCRAARVRSAAPAGAGGKLFPARHQGC